MQSVGANLFEAAPTAMLSAPAAAASAAAASGAQPLLCVQLAGSSLDGSVFRGLACLVQDEGGGAARNGGGSSAPDAPQSRLRLCVSDEASVSPCSLASCAAPSRLVLSHGCLHSASTRVPIVAACLTPDARLILAASLNAVVYAVDARTQQICGEIALVNAMAAAAPAAAAMGPSAAAPENRQPMLALAALANGARSDGVVDYLLLVGGADGSVGAWHAALTQHDAGADGGPRLRFARSDFGGLAGIGAAAPAGALAVRPTEAQVTCLALAAAPPASQRQLLVGDAHGRLALLRIQTASASAGARSSPRRAGAADAGGPHEPVLSFLSSSDALVVDPASRGDLASGGVSGIAACRLFARGAGPGGCSAAAASSDGRVALFCASADALALWPALVITTGEVLRSLCAVGSGAVATGGNGGVVRLWDVESARRHGAGGPPLLLASDEARCARLSPAQPVPAEAVARSEWICSLTCAGGGGEEATLLLAGRRTGELLAWAATCV